jgi:hypothetical protein
MPSHNRRVEGVGRTVSFFKNLYLGKYSNNHNSNNRQYSTTYSLFNSSIIENAV